MIAETLAFATGTTSGAAFKVGSKVVDALLCHLTSERDNENKRMELEQKGWSAARVFALSFKGGLWARRFIVTVVFTYLFVFPAIAAYLKIPLHYAYVEDGYWFWQSEHVKFKELIGFSILPFQSVIACYVAGFYFGASTVK